MECGKCSSGIPKGCKNNGICLSHGCSVKTSYDWLENMQSEEKFFPMVEVQFKNGRKDFYNCSKLNLVNVGDVVMVELEKSRGHDIGVVSMRGKLVQIQMKRKKEKTSISDAKKIYRKVNEIELKKWKSLQKKEKKYLIKSREIVDKLRLKMKISDLEIRGDGKKIILYYTSDERVDFRELLKELIKIFHIKIEFKQIGLRQESSRIGGIGVCGRELCCSSWLTDFRSVTTMSARYQQLSINSQRLIGRCGKLKCCINYELDFYLKTLNNFPKTSIKLKTKKGVGIFQKLDVFKEVMWYSYASDNQQWMKLSLSGVRAIISENIKGNLVESLEKFAIKEDVSNSDVQIVGQEQVDNFLNKKKDAYYHINRRKKKNRNV